MYAAKRQSRVRTTKSDDTPASDKWSSLCDKLKRCPEEVVAVLESCKIVYVTSRQREIYLSWHSELSWKRSINVDVDEDKLSYVLRADLTGLVINTNQNKLLLNKQIEFCVKLCPDVDRALCSFLFSLDTFHASFVEEELEFWKSEVELLAPSHTQQTSELETVFEQKRSPIMTFVWNLMDLSLNLKLKNCSCDFIVSSNHSNNYHPIWNSYLGECELKADKVIDNEVQDASLRSHLILQDFYAYVNRANIQDNSNCATCVDGNDMPALLPTSEQHIWGRILEIGKIEFQGECNSLKDIHSNSIYVSASGETNFVSFEWSFMVAFALKRTLQLFNKLAKARSEPNLSGKKPNKGSASLQMDIDLRIFNINLFALGDLRDGANSLLAKMGGIDISTGPRDEPVLWQINTLKIVRLNEIKKGESFICCASKMLEPEIVHVPSITACYVKRLSPKNLTLSIQNVRLDWNTATHMVIYDHLNILLEAKNSLQDVLPKQNTNSPVQDGSTLKTEVKLDVSTVTLKMKTSFQNSFGIVVENLCLQSSKDEISAKACDLGILFDDKSIFNFQDIEVRNTIGDELRVIRQKYPSISPENPRLVKLAIQSCSIFFPFQFDFASSLESLLNVVKMLKALHKKPKAHDYIEPLPPDLHITCDFLSIELEDDPFEIRLGENYLLRMDEMEECLEREEKLKIKLNDLQGAFVSRKCKRIEELMESLAMKNSQIYIKRSMAMQQDTSKRTFLLKSTFRNLSLAIMADLSLHGRENILNKMQQINSESPLPEGISFSTLWCRIVEGNLASLLMKIRDYQQPLLQMEGLCLSGTLLGAEQNGPEKSTREAIVHIDSPWDNMVVKKNMPPLKFYHDLSFDMDSFQAGWGVNFEPSFGMITQSLDLLSKASIDPSTPIPFWDKIRLLLHGTFKMKVREMNLALSASRDPNNITEKMEVVWENVLLTWTNACIVAEGDFDLHIRTASKYDDNRVLHFPAFKVKVDLEWLCEGDANDHHSVMPCDPAKVLSPTKTHDSYKLFRSSNLNMSVSLETGKDLTRDELKTNPPTLFLYASTFRWFQKYQAVVLQNVSRPIRRGSCFNNIKPKKPTLGRHYKFVSMDFSFSRLRVSYFGSFTQDAGFEMSVSSGSFGISYQVHVENAEDYLALIRRPVANWIVRDLRSELEKVSTNLISSLPDEDDSDEIHQDSMEDERQSSTFFLFSVKRVKYNRQSPSSDLSSYTHKVELNDFRGAWTTLNRKITFELFEAYTNMQTLKRILSSEALKASKDTKSQDFRRQQRGSFLDIPSSNSKSTPEQHFVLLQQLLSEQQSKFMAQVEESDTDNEGQAKNLFEEDIIQLNWHIELFNSQVMLKGCETKGALLITSANTQILKRLHRPVAADNEVATKLNKVTWTGKLSNLQYFATVKELSDLSCASIPWLDASIFKDMQSTKDAEYNNASNVAAFMKSSACVGSIVNVSMNGITTELQRVVSPCQCEFYYVSLDPELDPFAEEFEATQYTSTRSNAAFKPPTNLANTLLIRHNSLEISTSSEQYAMVIEICQKLLLYSEPKKKEQQDRLDEMKFKMQLSTGQNIKGEIQGMQDAVRDSLSCLRRYERQLYEYRRETNNISQSMDEDEYCEMVLATNDLQEQIEAVKEQLSAESEELKIMIRTYKDLIKNVSASPSPNKGRSKNYIVKQSDVIFDDMRWRLTQKDGQLGIADVQFKKFHYNKLTFNDNAGEHRFELGGFSVHNLIPNAAYKEALIPHEINLRRHVDKSVFLRVYCRVQSPVAGISIREHFEVNLCPIAVRLTHKFYHYLMKFFFPKRSVDQLDAPEFDMGVKGKEGTLDKDSEDGQAQVAFRKPAPPRPPPPRASKTSKAQLPSPQPTIKTPTLQPMNFEAEERSKRKSSLTLPVANQKDASSSQVTSPSVATSPMPRTPSVRKSSSFYNRFSTDENVAKMKERAARNQTFIYIKIPEIPICFSYKGEKDRNIEDAHDFNLCLPTLEYHNRTWTWQDLSMALKKDYTQVLVPQIIKEKLHLKGGWDNKQSMATKGDEDKAKLLLGEQLGTQKKAGKKLLFGKLSNLLAPKSANEQTSETKEAVNGNKDSYSYKETKSAQLSGKGIDPLTLQDKFERLRTVSTDKPEPHP
eukprot:gene14357-15855_t